MNVALRRFLPLLIIAFFTGMLFRFANQYGVAVFRMFGTWGIVAIGIWGSRILRGMQLEEGLRSLDERLRSLSAKVRVEPVGAAGRLPVWTLHTPKGVVLLGASDVANSARASRAQRALARQAQAVIDAARAKGALHGDEQPRAALVLLRRGIRGGRESLRLSGDAPPVTLVNPEGLEDLVSSWA